MDTPELPLWILFFFLFLLICCSAFFSSSETSMISLNRYKLKHLVQKKDPNAIRVDKMLQQPDKLIGLVLIGNNLVNILASAIATVIGIRLVGDAGVLLATVFMTITVLIFAEITPKTIAAIKPEAIAYPASKILTPLMTLFFPLVHVLNLITNKLIALLGFNTQGPQENEAMTSEELRTIVNESTGFIPKHHQEMLLGILELEKLVVEDIMIPKNDIYAIDINWPWKKIYKFLVQSDYTNILVYRETIDDVLGFIHVKELFKLTAKQELTKELCLRSLKDATFVLESTSLHDQLDKFRTQKISLGIIIDEYGDILGLITLSDILEEIIGDFHKVAYHKVNENTEIQTMEDGAFILDGSTFLRDLNKNLGINISNDESVTINGLILELLEDIPQHPMCLQLDNQYFIEVISIQENRVDKVKLAKFPQKTGS